MERAEARKQRKAGGNVRGAHLPRPTKAYAGTYHNPAHGLLTIEAANSRLAVMYNGFPFGVVPAGGDNVMLRCRGRAIEFPASFQMGKGSRVKGIAVMFERAGAPVVFMRKKRGT